MDQEGQLAAQPAEPRVVSLACGSSHSLALLGERGSTAAAQASGWGSFAHRRPLLPPPPTCSCNFVACVHTPALFLPARSHARG